MATEQPADAKIRDALRRVLASADFDASERNRRFVGFVVEEALAGRSPWLKAYTIATAVFGRADTFDPQTDAIVRIEARRLRDSLERYYLKAGKDDPVRITIPKGGYVPAFATAGHASSAIDDPPEERPAPESASHPAPPGILVAAFEDDGDTLASGKATRAVRRLLLADLARFTSIRVFGASDNPNEIAPVDRREVDYVLSGCTTLSESWLTVAVLLTDAATGQCLWGETFEQFFKCDGARAATEDVVGRIVRTVAEPYGIIFSRLVRDMDAGPPRRLDPTACVVRFHQYWRTYDPAQRASVRADLERAVAASPNYADAFACLSMLDADEHRFDADSCSADRDRPARAEALALRAIELSPNSSTAYQALSLARWFAGDVAASIAALETGRRLNPNDTTVMAELGLRHALIGNWHQAVPLLEAAYARHPALPSTYRVALALFHYMHHNYEEAVAEARRVQAPSVVYGAIMRAISAARLGRLDECRRSVAAILELAPNYGEIVEADLARRNVHPDIAQAVVDGLRAAGLPIGRPPFGHGKPPAPTPLRVVAPGRDGGRTLR